MAATNGQGKSGLKSPTAGKTLRSSQTEKEAATMSSATEMENRTVHVYDSLNYVAMEPLARDQAQSRRLHEPNQMITTIDPITGRDIEDLAAKPYVVDGNMVIYFESEQTRQAYLDTPMDHPVHLPDNPTDEWVAEG
jgi:hypothetical protein